MFDPPWPFKQCQDNNKNIIDMKVRKVAKIRNNMFLNFMVQGACADPDTLTAFFIS